MHTGREGGVPGIVSTVPTDIRLLYISTGAITLELAPTAANRRSTPAIFVSAGSRCYGPTRCVDYIYSKLWYLELF